MTTLSVKDRAKLFGDLAPKNRNDHVARAREFGNSAVGSPSSTTSGPVTYTSMSPWSGQFISSAHSASPSSAASVPYQRKDRNMFHGSPSYRNAQRNRSPAYAYRTSPRTGSPVSRNSLEWPEEENIPAPHSTRTSSYGSGRKIENIPDYLSKPVVLPTSPSPLNFPPQSPNWSRKSQALNSPLKVVQNSREQDGFSSPKTLSTPKYTNDSLTFLQKDGPVIHIETQQKTEKETVEMSRVTEKRVVLETTADDISANRSFVSDSENNAPENEPKPKSSRVMRLMRAKRATSPAPTSMTLKQSLVAAKTVIEEERSNAGSSNASSRSSLSNKELSDIASRALNMATARASSDDQEKPVSIRGIRTVSRISHQEARLALLSAAKKKNPYDGGNDVVTRSGDEATKAAKMNATREVTNDQGNRNLGISASTSSDSNKSKRLDHPAFSGRASLKPKTKVSSVDIMSSFRQFNSLRNNGTKSTTVTPADQVKAQESDEPESTEKKSQTVVNNFYLPAVKALNESLGREKSSTPPTTKEPTKKESAGKCKSDRLSTESGDNSMASQSSFLDQEETIHSMKQDDTMHDSMQQDESMHSMTDREYLDGFYQMGRLHVTSKNRVNDAYLSSLSSNTWATQSIMSQSLASSMKSPAGKLNQNERVAFLLEPTPEYSNQTMKSEILMGISPGPSNRSARSFANSIVSASPSSAAPPSPTFDVDFDDFVINTLELSVSSGSANDLAHLVGTPMDFLDTIEPSMSSGQGSDKDSAELLDAAVDAAVDDIMNEVFANDPNKGEERMTREQDSKEPPELRITGPPKETIEPAVVVSPKKRVIGAKSISILPTASGRSNSPPGFIFNDSEESDVIVPPDPTGISGHEGFILSDKSLGHSRDVEEINGSGIENGGSAISNQSHGAELRNGDSKVDSPVDFPVDFELVSPSKDDAAEKKGSHSSKKTVSSSIRTGFSSIQNDLAEGYEGSASIRTGLSGMQESQHKSNSIRASSSAFEAVPLNAATEVKQHLRETPKMPDTIHEETDTVSFSVSQRSPEVNDQDTSFSELKSKDDHTSFSGFKAKSTSTTDGSSDSRTGSGASATSELVSSYSGNDTNTGYDTPAEKNDLGEQEHDTVDQEQELLFKSILPPIQTDEEEEVSVNETATSFLTPASRKSSAAPWKGGNFGKRVGDAIKNVLAKASPRSVPSFTPPGHGTSAKQQESRSIFSSVDDDEDIFGGLDDDTIDEAKVPLTPKTPKDNAKTPKQRNSKVLRDKDTSCSTPASRKKSGTDKKNAMIKQPKIEFRFMNTVKEPSTNLPKKEHNRIPPSVDPASMYSDRSGTVVDESEVLHVNSDITSSLIGGPVSTPPNPPKNDDIKLKLDGFDEKKREKQDKRSPTSKSRSSRNSKSSKTSSTKSSKGEKKNTPGRKPSKSKTEVLEEGTAEEVLQTEEKKPAGSMFMRLSCGGLGDLSSGFASFCTRSKMDDLVDLDGEDDIKDIHSVSSHSRLTDLEKKVWSEWDRLNGSVIGGGIEEKEHQAAESKRDKPQEKKAKSDVHDTTEKKEDHDKKREAARDKLLDIASTALSSHLSGKTGSSMNMDGGDHGTVTATEIVVSSTDSSDSGSAASDASASASGTESGGSAGSSTQGSSNCTSTEYSSGFESDFVSEDPSNSRSSRTPGPVTPIAGPILLSFSQRSLMEKFSKQLTSVGVEVLKLNRRKQWQTRYFTVSKEQIALSAHEAISKTGELAHCPKALLWLKKFNPKTGGYGITNIDKDGHGGMLLVDLVEIQVSNAKSDTLENPLPKKLMDKFKDSVLVTLQYKMNGALRSIEFRCKDNDEAQFLCTCMRVIRDLLRRERSLRQKSNKQERKKASATVTASVKK